MHRAARRTAATTAEMRVRAAAEIEQDTTHADLELTEEATDAPAVRTRWISEILTRPALAQLPVPLDGQNTALTDLPTEVTYEIAKHLEDNVQSLMRMSATSRSWFGLLTAEQQWKDRAERYGVKRRMKLSSWFTTFAKSLPKHCYICKDTDEHENARELVPFPFLTDAPACISLCNECIRNGHQIITAAAAKERYGLVKSQLEGLRSTTRRSSTEFQYLHSTVARLAADIYEQQRQAMFDLCPSDRSMLDKAFIKCDSPGNQSKILAKMYKDLLFTKTLDPVKVHKFARFFELWSPMVRDVFSYLKEKGRVDLQMGAMKYLQPMANPSVANPDPSATHTWRDFLALEEATVDEFYEMLLDPEAVKLKEKIAQHSPKEATPLKSVVQATTFCQVAGCGNKSAGRCAQESCGKCCTGPCSKHKR